VKTISGHDSQAVRRDSSGKARMLAAMEGPNTVDLPVVITYLRILARDHWEQVTDVPWWATQGGDIEANLRVARDLQSELGIDWVPAPRGCTRQWRDRHKVALHEGRPVLMDGETGDRTEIVREPVSGFLTHQSDNLVHSAEDIDRLLEIKSAEEMSDDGTLDYASAAVREFGDDLFVIGSVNDPFWGMTRCFGIEGMLTNLVERPEWAERALERSTLASLEALKAYSRVGVDGIWLGSGYSSTDMISLEHFRRFAAPYAERVIGEINALGMKSVHYFCGAVHDRLEDLVGMNPACLAFEEDKKRYGLDIEWVDRVVEERACLFGNVDAIGVLQDGTRAEMAVEIDRQLEVGRRSGRFVMSLGSPVTPSTPIEKVAEFVQLVRERAANG